LIIFLFILVFLIIGISIFFAIYSAIQDSYKAFAQENSIALKELDELNSFYQFYDSENYDVTVKIDNINFFDEVYCHDYLIYELVEKKQYIKGYIRKIEINNSLINEYNQKLSLISDYSKFLKTPDKLNLDKLKRINELLFNKRIKTPPTFFSIKVMIIRTNINGVFQERKTEEFNMNQILYLINEVSKVNRGFYLNKEVWNALVRVERAKVSNKLRFAIFRRDGWRCRCCGSKYNLEIDHIKPVSRGGKSVPSNLQTLCRSCNKFKGTNEIRY